MLFEADFQVKGGNFNTQRQCFVSTIRNTSRVTNNYFGNGSLELLVSEAETLVATSQVTLSFLFCRYEDFRSFLIERIIYRRQTKAPSLGRNLKLYSILFHVCCDIAVI